MKEFIASEWRQIFTEQGLNFDSLWLLQLEPIQKPNLGRSPNGWSEVTCLSVPFTDGNKKRLILKRQQNHYSRTFCHPFLGIPTFEKELSNILRYKRLGIPVVEPIFYTRRQSPDGMQAVLITEYLEGYTPLDELTGIWKEKGWPKRAERIRLIKTIASVVRKLHDNGFQHNCLYPNHLLIRQVGDSIQVRLIDLEKNKWRPFGNGRRIRDLASLNRRTEGWSLSDRFRFLYAYCAVTRLDKKARQLCRQIVKRTHKKESH